VRQGARPQQVSAALNPGDSLREAPRTEDFKLRVLLDERAPCGLTRSRRSGQEPWLVKQSAEFRRAICQVPSPPHQWTTMGNEQSTMQDSFLSQTFIPEVIKTLKIWNLCV